MPKLACFGFVPRFKVKISKFPITEKVKVFDLTLWTLWWPSFLCFKTCWPNSLSQAVSEAECVTFTGLTVRFPGAGSSVSKALSPVVLDVAALSVKRVLPTFCCWTNTTSTSIQARLWARKPTLIRRSNPTKFHPQTQLEKMNKQFQLLRCQQLLQ